MKIITKAQPKDIKQIYDVMIERMQNMQNSDFFVPETIESLHNYVTDDNFILIFEEDAHFCGYFAVYIPKNSPDSLAHDLSLEKDLYDKVAHMESLVVLQEFSGQKIGKQLLAYGEKLLKEEGFEFLLATVHPKNLASLNCFLSLGYEILCTKEKYDGKIRHILCKKI